METELSPVHGKCPDVWKNLETAAEIRQGDWRRGSPGPIPRKTIWTSPLPLIFSFVKPS